MFKQEKGITLVALVITIIVLIILAGISITMVLGEGGLIDKAKNGGNDYKYAANVEANQLKEINQLIENVTQDL